MRGRARNAEDFWAVRDLSLQIPKGSVYGLIGHNGSGKSTLLKMIGGIYRPTEGTITTDGRVAALIELGAGFHPDMTGRENIALNGSILGLPRKEIADVTDEIIDFSGLGDFINDPVKHYSSGMYVRLGFSVAVHMKPDVLLIDEVLAVGDEEFQRKCFDHLYALRRSGQDDHRRQPRPGPAGGTVRRDRLARARRDAGARPGGRHHRRRTCARSTPTSPRATRWSPRVRDDDGSVRGGRPDRPRHVGGDRRRRGQPHHPCARPAPRSRSGWASPPRSEVLGPNVRIALQHDSGTLVTMLSNHRWGVDFGSIQGDHAVGIGLTDNPLLPGRYRVHIDVFDYTGSRLLDSWNDARRVRRAQPARRDRPGPRPAARRRSRSTEPPWSPSRTPSSALKRRAGRVKRWLKRKVYERNIGKQYKAWLAEAAQRARRHHQPRHHDLDHRPGLQPARGVPARVPGVGPRAAGAQLAAGRRRRRLDEAGGRRLTSRSSRASTRRRPRIVVVRKENGGISSALNAALEHATGDYVGMLDHDDLLDPRCIDEFSRALEEHGFPDAVYSDEDKVDFTGRALRALLQAGLLARAAADADVPVPLHGLPARRTWSTSAGCAREMDGAQDFDLALRLLPRLAARGAPASAAVPLAGLERVDRADDRCQAVGAGGGRARAAGPRRPHVRRRHRGAERGARA